jgi:hypothetical protein
MIMAIHGERIKFLFNVKSNEIKKVLRKEKIIYG